MKHSIYLALMCTILSANNCIAETYNALLSDIKKNIETYYVISESIPHIKTSLDDASLQQAVSEATSQVQIAEVLTQHLQQFDKHFNVQYIPRNQTSDSKGVDTTPKKEPWFNRLARNNAGFRQVSIKKGNVGVVEFWGFAALDEFTKKKIHAAMSMVEDVDALIIDLRENGGGSGETVSWLTSYFVDGRVHLNTFYTRHTDTHSRFYSYDSVLSKALQSVPLYIVIGPDTFSAAEEFAYNLKHLERATIIGSPSKGGANPWAWFPIDGGFRLGIPTTQAINPITKSNWEGSGVQPHVLVEQEKALAHAYMMALEAISSSLTNRYQRQDVVDVLNSHVNSRSEVH